MNVCKILLVMVALVFGPLQSYGSCASAGAAALSPKDAFLARAQRSASCLVVYNGPQGPEVLLGQRNYGGEQYADFGGLVDEAKDSALGTALRETEEETRGAYIPTPRGVFQLHELSTFNSLLNFHGHRETHHTIFVHEVSEKKDPGTFGATTHEQQEMTTYTWVLLKDLLSLRSPAEMKTKLGKSGDLLPEFLVLLKQPQVNSKLQAHLTAHSKQSVLGDLNLAAVERLALIESAHSSKIGYASPAARMAQMHAAEAAANLKAHYTKLSESVITFEYKSVNAWRTLGGFMGDGPRNGIVLTSESALGPHGLEVIWSSPDMRQEVQDVLRWSNRINTVNAAINRRDLSIKDRGAFTLGGTLDHPMLTASDAMLEHQLGQDFVPGDDVGNIQRFIGKMKSNSPIDNPALTSLFQRALHRERTHADKIVAYYGAPGNIAFLYALYQSLHRTLFPHDPRQNMWRLFDQDFVRMMTIDDIFQYECADNHHILSANMSAFHQVDQPQDNSFLYCMENRSHILQNLDLRLRVLFQRMFGVDLPDQYLQAFKDLYEKHFSGRGLLVQMFMGPRAFTQNVRMSGSMYMQLMPTEAFMGAPSDDPRLEYLKRIRQGHASELAAAADSDYKDESNVPFHRRQLRISGDPAIWDATDVSYSEYHPPLEAAQQSFIQTELRRILDEIFRSRLVKTPEKLWSLFHRQALALKNLLKDYAGVDIKHAPLDNATVVGFLKDDSLETMERYLQDNPNFLHQEFEVPAKALVGVTLPDSDAIVRLPVTEILLKILMLPNPTHGQSNTMKFFLRLMRETPDIFNLSDPRISAIATGADSENMQDLQALLFDRGIWGLKPLSVYRPASQWQPDEANIEYPSFLHVSSILNLLHRRTVDEKTNNLTRLGEFLSSREFKAYVLSIDSPPDTFKHFEYEQVLLHMRTVMNWSLEEIEHLLRNELDVNLTGALAQLEMISTAEDARNRLNNGDWSMYWFEGLTILDAMQKLAAILPAEERATVWPAVLKNMVQKSFGLDDWSVKKVLPILEHFHARGMAIPVEVGVAVLKAFEYGLDEPSEARDRFFAALPKHKDYIEAVLAATGGKIENTAARAWVERCQRD